MKRPVLACHNTLFTKPSKEKKGNITVTTTTTTNCHPTFYQTRHHPTLRLTRLLRTWCLSTLARKNSKREGSWRTEQQTRKGKKENKSATVLFAATFIHPYRTEKAAAKPRHWNRSFNRARRQKADNNSLSDNETTAGAKAKKQSIIIPEQGKRVFFFLT